MGIVKKMTIKSEDIILRTAELSDAEELLEIYAPYVEKTASDSLKEKRRTLIPAL